MPAWAHVQGSKGPCWLLQSLLCMVRCSNDGSGQPDRQITEGGFECWNTDVTTSVTVSLLGTELRLSQDPQSRHLGTIVRDASIVLAKWLERNARCLAHCVALSSP